MRYIEDILNFRSDLSPFLVHLTRDQPDQANMTASKVLTKIITERRLVAGSGIVSDARFAINTSGMSEEDKKKYFGAISFTETPLNEIHCLLEIQRRRVNLKPYGLVFVKKAAMKRGVEPVFYINNSQGNKAHVVRALCDLIGTNSEAAAHILPLVRIFGQIITPPGAQRVIREVNFAWEREWCYVPINGPYILLTDEIFIGLCPDNEIRKFERLMAPVEFIDPTRNMKWYATKLVAARQRLDLKESVV